MLAHTHRYIQNKTGNANCLRLVDYAVFFISSSFSGQQLIQRLNRIVDVRHRKQRRSYYRIIITSSSGDFHTNICQSFLMCIPFAETWLGQIQKKRKREWHTAATTTTTKNIMFATRMLKKNTYIYFVNIHKSICKSFAARHSKCWCSVAKIFLCCCLHLFFLHLETTNL